jgi:septum formation protein
MNMKIYLASSSKGRKNLLNNAGIEYKEISHYFDEVVFCDELRNNLLEYVLFVARKKIENIKTTDFFIDEKDNNFEFVVISADTMCESSFPEKKIIGKPISYDNVREILRSFKNGPIKIATGYCIYKYKFENNSINLIDKKENVVVSKIWIDLSEKDIEDCIKYWGENILGWAGAFSIEGFGQKYVQKIEGSYSNIIGLPLFEVLRDFSIY